MRPKPLPLIVITFITLVVAVSFLLTKENLSATSNTIAAPAKNGNATRLTNQLLRLAGRLEQASPERREAVLTQLIETAAQRQEALLNELESDPGDFLLLALPTRVLDRLPEAIQEYLEQHVEVEGELLVEIENDLDHGRSTVVHQLVSGEEPRSTYTLHFAANPPELLSDAVVRARGIALGRHLVLAHGDLEESLWTKTKGGGTILSGDQRIVVLLLNFTNDRSEPYTRAEIASLLFDAPNSTNQYYQETSFNHISLSGDVFGWYTVPFNRNASGLPWRCMTA